LTPTVAQPFVPRKGDICWLDFDPTLGVEQAKRTPALVLSPVKYNDIVGLCVVCPITSKDKNRRFQVDVPEGMKSSGVVLADHVKSLDWTERNAMFIEKAPDDLVNEVLDTLADLLEL